MRLQVANQLVMHTALVGVTQIHNLASPMADEIVVHRVGLLLATEVLSLHLRFTRTIDRALCAIHDEL